MKTFRYESISIEDLSATDLREKTAVVVNGEAYRITIYENERPLAEAAQALYDPESGRLGIAWGADAEWADVKSVENGIETWLNDPEAWETAN